MRGQQGSLPSSFTSVHLSRGALSHCSSLSSEAKSKTWARCVDECGQESLVRDNHELYGSRFTPFSGLLVAEHARWR